MEVMTAPPENQISSHICATMSQFDLKVATRANHAALLPVVLIATSINEARPTPVINIVYEDTALLQDGDKAIVQLVAGSNSVFGTANVIQELTVHFPFLTGKDAKVVSYQVATTPRMSGRDGPVPIPDARLL
jgi:glutamyl-tRNA synthetase